MHRGWMARFGGGALPLPVAEKLAGLGLVARAAGMAGLGVAFIGDHLDTACEELGRASREGRDRVLAVTSPGFERGATWRLLEAGAADVLTWDEARPPLEQLEARLSRWAQVEALLDSALVQENLVGKSTVWRTMVRQVVEVARFTGSSVLLAGESGTGKELVARLIHALDGRPEKRDLVILDCSTIVPELSGSEFFGHERGAFTGAVGPRDGAFELARGGTLFLDEVGELPLALQAQLLRVVQERTFKRVGGNAWLQTDFRLVCATNRDLEAEVEAGRFRRDLYHRIASWVCRLPPLRERRCDILPLVEHFLGPGLALDPAVRDFFVSRDYPGNVRELRQLVQRTAQRHVGGGWITAGDVPVDDRPHSAPSGPVGEVLEDAVRKALARGAGLKDIGRDATEAAIRLVVEEEGGNLQRASARLGVTDRALQLRRRSASGS